MPYNNKTYLYDLLLFSCAVAIFASSLNNGFVGDDIVYFVGNKTLMSFDLSKILFAGAIEVDYCPLRDLSLAIDYQLWGANPFGFHLSNIILFGVTVVMVRRLFVALEAYAALQFGKDKHEINVGGSLLAALLFAAHPMHGEVVYAINHRGIILAGLGVVLSCIAYINYLQAERHKWFWYCGAMLFFLMAILSKEYSIILPLLLLFFVVLGDRRNVVDRLVGIIPFFMISGIFYVVFKTVAVSARFIAPTAVSLFSGLVEKAAVAVEIIAYYLFRVFNAEKIGMLIENSEQSTQVTLVVFSLAVVTSVLYGVTTQRKRHPQLFVGFMLYLLCLLPVLNFFKTFPITADRFFYLPSIGLFHVFSVTTLRKYPAPKLFLITVVFCIFAVLSFRQSANWKDNVVFWENIASHTPSLNNYANLGMVYLGINNQDKAREAFSHALDYTSESPGGTSRGDILLMLGRNEEAIQAFESVLKNYRDSDEYSYFIISWQLYNNLSKAYMNTGNLLKAIEVMQNSIRLKPDSAGLYNSLGVLYAETRQYDLAVKTFEKSMSLDVDYGFAPLNLAKTYLAIGDRNRATSYLHVVRERFPDLRVQADKVEAQAP